MFNDKPWFQPKRYGLGSGLPIAWQGWLLMVVHVGGILLLAILFADRPALMLATVLPWSFLPLPIYAAKTQGGWKWRWGEED
nr:hypothetical protein [uncultured Sphingomonas sp.]